jgi:hypothetical protein
MNEPLISIVIDRSSRVHFPGERLSGAFQIDAVEPEEIQAVELSVLWYTQGKGDEDLGVHHFERFTGDYEFSGKLHELRRFETTLPLSPLSYDGLILKIHWCVRVRVFLTQGREYVAQTRFQLGNLPPADLMGQPEKQASSPSQPQPPGLEARLSWNASSAPLVIGPVRMRRVVAGRVLSS